MRPRFAIFLLILVAVMVAIILWRWPVRHPVNPKSPSWVQTTNSAPAAPTAPANAASLNNPSPRPQSIVATPANTSLATNYAQRRSIVIQAYNEQNNAPIEFYGEVVDQDSNLLAGVKIDASIQQDTAAISPSNDVAISSKVVRLEQETKADGRFEIIGETGGNVTVDAIQKDGYEAEPGPRTFGAVAGSFENPVLFKMWNDNIHEKLITGDKAFPIVPDGRPYFINLTDGTISESGPGDLKAWVKRPAQVIYGHRYDWSCEVDAINGSGLLQETDAGTAMYEAPTDGYTPSFSYEEDVTTNGWGDTTGAQRFYVRLNDGQEYGRITIELEAYYNDHIPGMVRLSYAINPSGSRILR